MDQSSVKEKKNKFTHSKSKVLFCGTFFHNHEIYYIVQCESWEVFVGNFQGKFKIAWKGNIKQQITCISHCHKHKILYAGTIKGTIAVINLKEEADQESGKIEAVNGQPIIAMFAYSNEVNHSPEIIAINKEGILRKYENNKFTVAKQLPFKVRNAISNKTIRDKNDVAMVLLKQNGAYPYIFSAEFYIELCKVQTSSQSVLAQIEEYDSAMNYQQDQKVDSSKVTAITLSNSKTILAIATKDPNTNTNLISIFKIAKQNNKFYLIADFKFSTDTSVINMDIVDSSILYICQKSISAYDIQLRRKVVNGLKIENTEYNLVFWCQLPNLIVFGSTLTNSMKLSLRELKFSDKNKQE